MQTEFDCRKKYGYIIISAAELLLQVDNSASGWNAIGMNVNASHCVCLDTFEDKVVF